MRAKRIKSLRSFWYARLVCRFVMLANHSISGGTSAKSKNSFALSARAFVGIRARDDFFFCAIDVVSRSVGADVGSLTPAGFLWANIRSIIGLAFTHDKRHYRG